MASAWRNFKKYFFYTTFHHHFSTKKKYLDTYLFHFDRVNHGRISHIFCVKQLGSFVLQEETICIFVSDQQINLD